jgi:uridine phosphorylase
MSNHARGLWGYTGRTASGLELTVQATGMGGPSAAIVLADLAKLGVQRAVRVGSCHGLGPHSSSGDLLTVGEALAGGGSAASFGVAPGTGVTPDPALLEDLRAELGDAAREAAVVSLDTMHEGESALPDEAAAADLQTVAVLARAKELGIAAAAVLIVSEAESGEALDDAEMDAAAKRCGRAAAAALSI